MKTTLSGRLLNPTAAEFVPAFSFGRSPSSTSATGADGTADVAGSPPDAVANGHSTSTGATHEGVASVKHDALLQVSNVIVSAADEATAILDQLCEDNPFHGE